MGTDYRRRRTGSRASTLVRQRLRDIERTDHPSPRAMSRGRHHPGSDLISTRPSLGGLRALSLPPSAGAKLVLSGPPVPCGTRPCRCDGVSCATPVVWCCGSQVRVLSGPLRIARTTDRLASQGRPSVLARASCWVPDTPRLNRRLHVADCRGLRVRHVLVPTGRCSGFRGPVREAARAGAAHRGDVPA